MPVRCALAYPNGKAYLFANTHYSRHNFRSGLSEDANLDIAANWPGLPSNAPDAAVLWGAGKIYFFYGDEYLRFDVPSGKVDPEYLPPNPRPKIVPNWGGLPINLDAIMNWGNGKLYAFKGPSYFRYDITMERVDAGYPRPIAGNWPGIWSDGIDDVLYQGGRFAYFFKEERYVRYDVYADTADSDKPLSALTLDPVPSGMVTAARDLTLAQANEAMGYLIDHGKLALSATQTPYSGPWTAITSPSPSTHVVIRPPIIDGITYQDDAGPAPVIDNVDQRMVVALYRFARWVNASEPTIDMIKHLGIGHGIGPANDCHNQGRALDFSGLVGTSLGTPFNKRILTNWGNLPSTGSALRLNPATDPLAHQLFLTAFRFGTFECECNGIGAANKWPVKNVGDPGGFVIHPDYVDVDVPPLRPSHQNHIHMQLGPTRAPTA
ncbi:hemopexin repeat-containing protein [Bradyrhizobium sp. DOA9]|uniref:hemopexin repeat-containing protein n=1 Tax=Bradyrhizobium sp. DOA9 TaxID=1126627 RepID=UPI00046953B0|nr:hemopexin repeat-containing protein [Bradyrhizobium sp. DOA9]GAJ36954.1 hypothetical protein BDOA9_0161720 [Bradyrhizobium sp. DOA9]